MTSGLIWAASPSDSGCHDSPRSRVLWIHPFFVGHGGPANLLYRDTQTAVFELADVTTLKSGMAILTHRYAGKVS